MTKMIHLAAIAVAAFLSRNAIVIVLLAVFVVIALLGH
jgi:hypothetical protein